jgi:hypothetical protein
VPVGIGVRVGLRVGVELGEWVPVGIGVGDIVGIPVGEGVAPIGLEVGVGISVGVAVGVAVAIGVCLGVGVGVWATTPFPVPSSFTAALALPLVALLVTLTVVANAVFEDGWNEIIAVAVALGSRIVPDAGSLTIENACEGLIVIEVMVSAALPVFAMTNLFSPVAALPNDILVGVTLSLLNRGWALAGVCCADASAANAKVRKTQPQSAAMYRRVIAPQ